MNVIDEIRSYFRFNDVEGLKKFKEEYGGNWSDIDLSVEDPKDSIFNEIGNVEMFKAVVDGIDISNILNSSPMFVKLGVYWDVEMLSAYIENGLDIVSYEKNLVLHDEPSLHIMIEHTHRYNSRMPIAKLLIDNGADVRAKNKEGKSPKAAALGNHRCDLKTIIKLGPLLEEDYRYNGYLGDDRSVLVDVSSRPDGLHILRHLHNTSDVISSLTPEDTALIIENTTYNVDYLDYFIGLGVDMSNVSYDNSHNLQMLAENVRSNKAVNNLMKHCIWEETDAHECNIFMYAADFGNINLMDALNDKLGEYICKYDISMWSDSRDPWYELTVEDGILLANLILVNTERGVYTSIDFSHIGDKSLEFIKSLGETLRNSTNVEWKDFFRISESCISRLTFKRLVHYSTVAAVVLDENTKTSVWVDELFNRSELENVELDRDMVTKWFNEFIMGGTNEYGRQIPTKKGGYFRPFGATSDTNDMEGE